MVGQDMTCNTMDGGAVKQTRCYENSVAAGLLLCFVTRCDNLSCYSGRNDPCNKLLSHVVVSALHSMITPHSAKFVTGCCRVTILSEDIHMGMPIHNLMGGTTKKFLHLSARLSSESMMLLQHPVTYMPLFPYFTPCNAVTRTSYNI